MPPVIELTIPSAEGTIPARMPRAKPPLTTEQAIKRIEAAIGRPVPASSFRRMLADQHPAMRLMVRMRIPEQRQNRWPLRAVNYAIKHWPSSTRGARREIKPEVEAEIVKMRRDDGFTLQAIADALAGSGVRTPNGKRIWDRSTILRVLVRHGLSRSGEDGAANE